MGPHTLDTTLELFGCLAAGHRAQQPVARRSKSDKEYPAQDWVARTAAAAGLQVTDQNRHAPIDMVVGLGHGECAVGVQAKGLHTRPNGDAKVRRDLDCSSTIPSPARDGVPNLLAFAKLHPPRDGAVVPHSLCLAEMALLQDVEVAGRNRSVTGAGGYGDITLRIRHMFVADHPITLAARAGIDIDGHASLILDLDDLPAADGTRRGLRLAGTIRRKPATRRMVSVTSYLDGRDPEPVYEPVPARPVRRFGVWLPTATFGASAVDITDRAAA